MKRYATFFVIAVMSLGLVFLLLTKDREKHDAPAEIIPPPEAPAADDAGAADASAEAAAEAAAPTVAPQGDKPLRVTSLGWELVAAGAALTPADRATTTPPMELSPETALDAVEARLARGGADPQGADVAVLPLPAFVASYERLRALEPRAFLVVGFSRGREEVHAAPGALQRPPPAADEVKVVAFGPATASDATARAAGSESATIVGLFALDLLGVPASRVRLVAPGRPEAKAATLAAVVHGAADERKLAFSTADASRLVPIVAVAPKGVVEAREAELKAFSLAWLDGLARAAKDAPGVARRLAAKESLPLGAGIGGAPEAIHLVERLGQIEASALADQRTLMGADAKGPVTLEALAARTWQLARAGGLATSPAPEPSPIDPRIVTAIAPAPPPKEAPKDAAPADADGGIVFAPAPSGASPLASYRAVDVDDEKVVERIGFVAAVFPRAILRVSAKGGEKAARTLAATAKDRFGLPASRLSTAGGEPVGAVAVVEILSPP